MLQILPTIRWCGAGVAVASIAACGSVQSLSDAAVPPDATVADGTPADGTVPDGSLPSCVATQAEIASIESADPGYGSICVRGGWTLGAANGQTTPMAVDQPFHSTLVSPVALARGENPLVPSSTYAVHVSGSGQMNTADVATYAQLTASLNRSSTSDIGTVDASNFTGIQFFAKLSTGGVGMRLTVGNLFTDPVGGRCTPGGKNMTECFDNPGAQLAPHDGAAWVKYQVRFDELTQLGFGTLSPVGGNFPREAITHIKWDIGIPQSGAVEPWDLWIDEVTFF